MKLLKSFSVLVTLGLLAPMSATANAAIVTSHRRTTCITNSRVDGLEARLNNMEAEAFRNNNCIILADFAIGAVDGKGVSTTITDGDETLQAIYGFQIDLNTSFTGEDSLDISIDAGNASTNTAGSQTGPLLSLT